jgi:hypothetical protein
MIWQYEDGLVIVEDSWHWSAFKSSNGKLDGENDDAEIIDVRQYHEPQNKGE